MSGVPDPKEALLDELNEQADMRDLVGDGDLLEGLDVESLGRTMGESLGAVAGRRLGRGLARRARSTLPFTSDTGRAGSLVGRVARALVVALVRTFSRPPFRDALGELFSDVVDRREAAAEAADEATDAVEGAADSATDAADAAAETAEDAAEEATDAATDAVEAESEAEAETAGQAAEALPGDLDDVKRDTYRELLEVLSYSDLQSVAKSVGVKANLGREEMTDAIVEEFSEEGEGEKEAEPNGDGDTDEEDEG